MGVHGTKNLRAEERAPVTSAEILCNTMQVGGCCHGILTPELFQSPAQTSPCQIMGYAGGMYIQQE